MPTRRSLITALCCAAAMTMWWSVDVNAHHTYFTFTHAVEIPGSVTLPPGRYEFRDIQSTADRRLVEVRDARTQVWFATLLAVPAEHAGMSDRAQVRFMDRENEVPALLFWWDDERSVGLEFVYPREQALRLSRSARTSLATSTSPMLTPGELRAARIVRTNVSPEPVGTSGSAPLEVAAEPGPH